MPESSSDAPTVKIKLSAMSSESAGGRESSGEMWVGISSNSPSPPPNLDRPRQNSAAGEQLTGFRGFEALRESARFAAGLVDLILIDECILETCSLNPRSFERSPQ